MESASKGDVHLLLMSCGRPRDCGWRSLPAGIMMVRYFPRRETMADVQRRLSAMFCADVAGDSRLMGADEAGTLAALKGHRQAIDPLIAAQGGRIVKTTGDG